MAGGSLIAMDAEQQRAANGQFGSGGKISFHEDDPNSRKPSSQEWKDHWKGEAQRLRDEGKISSAKAKDEAPPAYNMSGEVGRQARKLARDCNTGRFRP